MTQTIDGKAVAEQVRAGVARGVADLVASGGRQPALATVLVGDDPASAVYVASKRRTVVALGMRDEHRHLPASATQEQVAAVVGELAADPAVSGILLQLPLPPHLDAGPLIEAIPAGKDVDGLTAVSAGRLAGGQPGLRPCTPSGVIELLRSAQVPLRGANAVVVGRSTLVGRPMAALLLLEDATVTVAHSRTRDLASLTRGADVLVVAAGVPGLVGAEHVSPGTAVIDVGIHRTATGLVGDVRTQELVGTASHVTPVPGGVGPMTIAMLMKNTLEAAR